ncbi:MAG: hypothetical protein HN737_02265 [Desulfobacterales bacterium]|jgi:hypothetical protein|nr:hypothetical protein [Desulfobacterales bacterium]MBT7696214.1 hypothetical protein [Desulfobacterales bacterium]
MAAYKGAECLEKEFKGEKGFDECAQWLGDHFEWARNPKRMAYYVKRVLFPRFFYVSEFDNLFDLSEKYPIVLEEAATTPYDFTTMVMLSFMAMSWVSDDLKERIQFIINADMTQVAQVVGKVQKA